MDLGIVRKIRIFDGCNSIEAIFKTRLVDPKVDARDKPSTQERAMSSYIPSVSPDQLHGRIQQGGSVHLIDVRSPAEYREGHAVGAVSMPFDGLDAALVKSRFGPSSGVDEPLYLICASGLRATLAARKLQSQGIANLVLVDGGTKAWSQQQLPLRRTAKVISLERQTQIALGMIILLMLTKGALLHPLFYILVGLVAVGLVFAGMTGSCSLSAIMAKMPWNRTAGRELATSA